LLGAFAAVAQLLAAIGLYGVIAYTVTQRTREFGIRMALGARQSEVVGLVLRHGLKLMGAGLALGLAGAFSLAHLLENLLFEIRPTDPWVLGGTALLLLGIATLASLLPALRAAKVDPMIALRCE
jgi:ABC-type antimicrobial peptide transport system permease subunit